MSEVDYSLMFPETGWMCPYCMEEPVDEQSVMCDRKDIPSHLVFQHDWDSGKHLNWEYIYNRLSAVGGV